MNPEIIDPYKQDFRNFMYVVWKHLGLPDPTPTQYAIAYYLQHSPKRCIIEAFRGVGKSYITVAYVCWKLYCDPQVKIMVVSAGKERADAFSIFVKSLIRDVPMLKHLQPDPSRGQRDSNVAFDVGPATPSGSPSVKSVGISGQLTGSRANLIVADDIEIPSNSATHDLRAKLGELVKEFAAVLSPAGQILYLGTPQTELSLYNILETRGYQMRVWCARYPTAEQVAMYGSRLAPDILDALADGAQEGASTDPLRFDDEDLIKRELEYGKSGFALQFMLDTSLSDLNKYPLKINDLIISSCQIDKAPNHISWSNNPLARLNNLPNVAMAGQYYYSPEIITAHYEPYNSSVMVIDPSGRGTDETGYTVAKMASGNVYIPDSGGMLGGYSDETLIALCEKAKQYKVNTILVESNFGDGMFTSLLTPHMNRIYPCKIEEVRQNQQKELRIIESLEAVMNQHRLIIDPHVIEQDYKTAMDRYSPDIAPQYMLFYQLARISKARGALKHDDRLDSLAMAVHFFTDQLAMDAKATQQRRNDDAWDAMLEKYVQETKGRTDNKQLTFHDRMRDKIMSKR